MYRTQLSQCDFEGLGQNKWIVLLTENNWIINMTAWFLMANYVL